MIEISDLTFAYPDGVFGLAIERLTFDERVATAVVGPSGSGKTTLLSLISGLLVPHSGTVDVAGTSVSALPDGDRRAWRLAHVGMVFQDFELLPWLSVIENILLPVRIAPAGRVTAATRDRARALAQAVGLERHSGRAVTRLSQGERQRVAIARALMNSPALILGDEPTGNLDPRNTELILDLLFEQVQAHNATLIMVTHDHSLLSRFDREVNFTDFLTMPAASPVENTT